jgi:hypothetical protein
LRLGKRQKREKTKGENVRAHGFPSNSAESMIAKIAAGREEGKKGDVEMGKIGR